MKTFLKKRILISIFAISILFVGTSFKNDFFELAKQIEIFTTLFKKLNMNYVDETNPAELMDTAIKNMLDDLDPYTRFMNEQDVEAYKIRQKGEYSGIGAIVRSYNDRLLIVEPYKSYPADKAGLKAGDEIIKVGNVRVVDFKDNAADLLKGAINSKVAITFKRQGKVETTTLTREEIEVDAVPYYKKIDEKTGYIVLSTFNKKATEQTRNALEDLKLQGMERLVLDLRGNPGGLLSEAIGVTNLFVDKGEVIVTTKSKVKKFNKVYKTKRKPVDMKIALVVLVDGRSASASEIVSGALQDLDRAVVIGTRSFGKGLVQQPMKLAYGTQLKVTISRYYTPSGRCIQALDYWNRDENGKAVRTDAKQYNSFKTRNGRVVYDGGGVNPDVEVAGLKNNGLIRALLANNLIFDFATDYYYKNRLGSIADFSFAERDFNDFKSFVSKSSFSYETKTEKALKKLITDEETEVFGAVVKEDYKKLLADIEKSKLTALDIYKVEIMREIRNEIVKRYFYRMGLYDYYLQHDEAVVTSTKILKDSNRYSGLLGN